MALSEFLILLPVVHNLIKHYLYQLRSFSLIEVVIFVGILALFFVTSMIVVTASLKQMKTSEHRIVAAQYAEELMSWIKTQKDSDWNAFIDNYTAPDPGKIYCFNDLTIVWPDAAGECGYYTLGTPTLYKREATLISVGSQVEVNLTVEWSGTGNRYSIPLNTVLLRLE